MIGFFFLTDLHLQSAEAYFQAHPILSRPQGSPSSGTSPRLGEQASLQKKKQALLSQGRKRTSLLPDPETREKIRQELIKHRCVVFSVLHLRRGVVWVIDWPMIFAPQHHFQPARLWPVLNDRNDRLLMRPLGVQGWLPGARLRARDPRGLRQSRHLLLLPEVLLPDESQATRGAAEAGVAVLQFSVFRAQRSGFCPGMTERQQHLNPRGVILICVIRTDGRYPATAERSVCGVGSRLTLRRCCTHLVARISGDIRLPHFRVAQTCNVIPFQLWHNPCLSWFTQRMFSFGVR